MEDPNLQHWQEKGLAIAPKVSAPLSIVGSSFIIFDILRSPQKIQRTYCRLMLGMSIIDIGFSFFIQLGVGAPLYNGSLSIFYLFVVALSMTDEKMKRIEWILHLVPISFSLMSAIIGLPFELYNSTGLWCWIASLPRNCENGSYREGVGQCQRGQYAWIFRWAMYYVPIWFCIGLVSINMYVVVHLVWAKQKASQQFDFERTVISSREASSSGGVNNNNDNNDRSSWGSKLSLLITGGKGKKQKKKKGSPDLVSQVAWQAALYLGSFYVSWLPVTILRTLTSLKKEMPYWVILMVVLVTPLQGSFNCLIYLRPRALKYKKDNPALTSFGSLTQAFKKTLMLCKCCGDSINDTNEEGETNEEGDTEDVAVMDPISSSSASASEPVVVDEEDPAHSLQIRNSIVYKRNSAASCGSSIKPRIQLEAMDESPEPPPPEEIIENNSNDDNNKNNNNTTQENASVAPREESSFSEPQNA